MAHTICNVDHKKSMAKGTLLMANDPDVGLEQIELCFLSKEGEIVNINIDSITVEEAEELFELLSKTEISLE